MENQKEIWKDLGSYEVSNLGNVLSKKFKKPRKLKQDKSTGYCRVNISGKWQLVHRLVAVNFIPNKENKPQVNHINGIKQDNRSENLEWSTASENQIHAFKNGLTNKIKGESHFFSKLKKNQVLEIIKSKLKQKELAEIYKVSQTSISNIKRQKTWKF